ncbi:MAG: hypothetical protein MR215_00910, partial [Bacteroidales bacterium]|nr:hypothetical protein [Bacteroidales bacterium]
MKTNFLILSLAATAALTNFTSCIDDEDMDATSQQILDQKKNAELVKAQTALVNAQAALAKAEVTAKTDLINAKNDLVNAKVNFKVFNGLTGQSQNLYSIYLGMLDAESDYENAQENLLYDKQKYDVAVAESEADIATNKNRYSQWLAVAEYDVAIYEKQIEEYKEAIANYEEAGTAEQIEALTKEIEDLQAQLDAVNVKRAEYKAEIESQNAGLSSQIEVLYSRMNTLGDENGNITYPNDEKLASLQAKIYELEAQKEKVQAEYDEWKDAEEHLSFTVLDYSVIEKAPLFYYDNNGFSRDENTISGDFKNSEIISSTSDYSWSRKYWSEEVDGSTTTLYCYIHERYSSEAMFAAFYATLKNITEEYSYYKETLKTQYNMFAKLEKGFTDLYEAKVATRDDYEKKLNDLADEISDYEQQKSDYISDIYKQIGILYGMMPSTTKAELENEKNELTVKISGKRRILNVYIGIQNEFCNYEDGLACLNSKLQNAQSDLVNAQNNVETYKSALEKIESGLWSSSQNVETLKLALENAQKKADTAKTNLDYYIELYKATL